MNSFFEPRSVSITNSSFSTGTRTTLAAVITTLMKSCWPSQRCNHSGYPIFVSPMKIPSLSKSKENQRRSIVMGWSLGHVVVSSPLRHRSIWPIIHSIDNIFVCTCKTTRRLSNYTIKRIFWASDLRAMPIWLVPPASGQRSLATRNSMSMHRLLRWRPDIKINRSSQVRHGVGSFERSVLSRKWIWMRTELWITWLFPYLFNVVGNPISIPLSYRACFSRFSSLFSTSLLSKLINACWFVCWIPLRHWSFSCTSITNWLPNNCLTVPC